MQQRKRKIRIRKLWGFCFLFITISILTFVCRTCVLVKATGTGVTSTEGSTAGESDKQTNPTENDSNGNNNLTGNIGNYQFSISTGEEDSLAATLKMLLLLTVITLAPSILIMVTSFTRIIVSLHFLRTAIGTQTTPPNQVMVGLALFLTLFIMSPTFMKINSDAVEPLTAGEITQEEAFKNAENCIRDFIFTQMDNSRSEKDLNLFLEVAGISSDDIQTRDDIPTTVLIPAFIINELRTAFIIGFLIYIPFIVIDMVVASTLMSMGMMMLPPTTISMPFKILLFIMADGWNLIIGQVVKTFTLY